MDTKPLLAHLEDFRLVLHDYKPSEDSLDLLHATPLVLMVAPTSSGRNTVIRELLKSGDYHYIVSDTTRQKRINDGVMEQDGVEYWFRSEEDVLRALQEGRFLEAALIHNQQVSGISMREIEAARNQHQIAITDIEIVGAETIVAYKPETACIFLLPPGFDEWMRRIQHRGDMAPEELRRRLNSAVFEITTALDRDYYHFVVNRDLSESVQAVDSLARGNRPDVFSQEEARDHARNLVVDIDLFLANT